jgi:hypothetical protein
MKHNRNYKIRIPEYDEGELYKRAMENCRLNDLKKKADIEAEWNYQKRYIGSPLPRNEMKTYFENIVKNYKLFKKPLKLW